MNIIKCPQCSGSGYKYLQEGRYYFFCYECELCCLLKLLSSYRTL